MTNKDADKVVRWFQSNIGLAGWSIRVTIGEPPPGLGDDLRPDSRDGLQGRCVHRVAYHDADVWINPPGHATRENGSEISTLIHELLHCFFASCDIDDDNQLAEYAVNRLANALEQNYLK